MSWSVGTRTKAAVVLMFIASAWLLWFGVLKLDYYIQHNAIENVDGAMTVTYPAYYMVTLAVFTITAGCAYIASGINILHGRNLAFTIASIVYGCILAVLLGHYDDVSMAAERPDMALFIGIPVIILSALALVLVMLKKE